MLVNEIHGLFTINHLIYTILSFLLVIVLIYLSIKLNTNQIKKQIKIIGIIVISLEIIKIIYMITDNRSPNDYVPLYYCSLLIYFLFLIYIKNEKIQQIGYSLIMYNGLIPALAYILYPITAINFHPLISFDTIHSLIYHSLMLYLSLIIMIKKIHLVCFKDVKIFLVATLSLCLVAYIVNAIWGTFFMFINNAPFDNPILVSLENIVGFFYPFVIAFAQTFGSFIGAYFVYKFIQERID